MAPLARSPRPCGPSAAAIFTAAPAGGRRAPPSPVGGARARRDASTGRRGGARADEVLLPLSRVGRASWPCLRRHARARSVPRGAAGCGRGDARTLGALARPPGAARAGTRRHDFARRLLGFLAQSSARPACSPYRTSDGAADCLRARDMVSNWRVRKDRGEFGCVERTGGGSERGRGRGARSPARRCRFARRPPPRSSASRRRDENAPARPPARPSPPGRME